MIATKMKSKKGFTLMEMLIVVAIMVVLIVIALPVFTQQLDKAKAAVDDANLRSGKVLASALYMLGDEDFSEKMYYDIVDGVYVSEEPEPYGKTTEHSTMVISAIWDETSQQIILQWE